MPDRPSEYDVANLFLEWVEMTAKIDFYGGNEMFGGLKFLWDYAQERDLSHFVAEYACVFAQGYHYMYCNGLKEKLTLSDLESGFLSKPRGTQILEKSIDEIYSTVETWILADENRYETLLADTRRGLLQKLLKGFDPKASLTRWNWVREQIKSSGNPPAVSTDQRSDSNSHGTSRPESSVEDPSPTHESNPASSGFRSSDPGNDHHWK
jgi:hypothetical protein